MEYIDTHTHMNLAAFKDDYEELIERTLAVHTGMVNVGTEQHTSVLAIDLASSYTEGVYATVGLHPVHTSKSFFDVNELDVSQKESAETGEVFESEFYRELARHPKVVAIGECGLDYFHDISDEAWRRQVEAFEAQIDLANRVGKPLMLHLRSGSRGNAYQEAHAILAKSAKVPGNAHFFTGSLEDAKLFWDRGYSTSFTGVLTFTHDYDEVVRHAPCDLLHAETDAPYVAPVPYRGKRNEPLHVREVVQKMAEIRGVSTEVLQQILLKNAEKLYGIR